MNDEDDNLQPRCSFCCTQLLEPYIECTQCENVNLCTHCFSKGSEVQQHKSDHEYSIRRNDFPLFDNSDWSAKDEYLLLQAVSRHGYGNWLEVSKTMQKYSELQCKDHYNEYYINNRQCTELPKLERWSVMRKDPPFLFKEYISEDLPRKVNSDINQSLAGYNPFRSDFENNYDNHAEQLLHFKDDEDDEDTFLTENLQCAVVMAYNNRLKERQRRYEIIRRHGLIVFRKFSIWLQEYEKYLGKNLCDGLTSFMQLMSAVQFDSLVVSLSREKELRLHLFQLYEYRKKGITTFKGSEIYEMLRRRREEHLKELRSSSIRELDWKSLSENNPSVAGNINTDLHCKSNKRKAVPPLEIIGLPDYENLNDKERDFCSNVRLLPASFIKFRDLLIAENERNGFLRLCDARKLIKIDVNKTRKIFDMLVQEGVVNKPL